MSYTKIDVRGLSEAEWLKLRQQGIGGSDVGAICGINPYKSPLEVYYDKKRDYSVETVGGETDGE